MGGLTIGGCLTSITLSGEVRVKRGETGNSWRKKVVGGEGKFKGRQEKGNELSTFPENRGGLARFLKGTQRKKGARRGGGEGGAKKRQETSRQIGISHPPRRKEKKAPSTALHQTSSNYGGRPKNLLRKP